MFKSKKALIGSKGGRPKTPSVDDDEEEAERQRVRVAMANTRNQGVEHTTDLRFLLISDHLKPTLKSPAMQCSNIPLPSLVLTLERLHRESFTTKLFENAYMFYPGN